MGTITAACPVWLESKRHEIVSLHDVTTEIGCRQAARELRIEGARVGGRRGLALAAVARAFDRLSQAIEQDSSALRVQAGRELGQAYEIGRAA